MPGWYNRPVIFVVDVPSSLEFYELKLGFAPAWRYEEGGVVKVAQVDREGCELILSSQWPAKVGTAMMFVSLDRSDFDALWSEFSSRGVVVVDGHWGYPSKIISDPDGNQLYFPHPDEAASAA